MKQKAIISLLILLVILFTGCSTTGGYNKTSDTSHSIAKNTPFLLAGNTARKTNPPTPEREFGYDFESTWGDLIESEGRLVYDTLTKAQQALVHYPKVNISKVYYVPKGKSYHSVDWCYTLSQSKEIHSMTLSEALNKRLDPCSKCVGN